jgi:hypothetical protein
MTTDAIAANASRMGGRLSGNVCTRGQRCVFLAALPGARSDKAVVMT